MFAKLSSEITKSSLWDEPDHVVRVWITFLAEKDCDGFVRGTNESLRRISNVYDDKDGKKFDEAVDILENPDPNSRTKDFEGRRVERVDGGWIVLNHEQYKTHEDIKKEQNRERVKRWREKFRKSKTEEAPEKPEATPPKKEVEFTIPDYLEDLWPRFTEMRRAIKKTATKFAQKNIAAKLERLAPEDHEMQRNILIQSIDNSWQDVYLLKKDFKPKMTNYLGGESQ